MPKEQEIKIKISGNVDSSFNKSLDAASKKLNEVNKSTGDTSKSFSDAEKSGVNFGEKSSDAISTLDAVLASAGISAMLTGVASAFDECVKAADEYETALAKISTIADTSQKSMSEIKSEISALSSETGQSVTDISEATYQAISASVDTADAVEFVNKANMLAVGGFTDVTSAVDVLTTAINAYGLESSEASRISDMLVQTQNLGKTTVNELAQSLGTVIPIASAYNVNMENISAAYAELTKNGIDTANAGTYIRATLNELADSGSTVSKTLYEKTGKSFSMLMDSGKSLGDVIEILGNSVDGDSTAFANLWGNVRASTGALSIFNSGSKAFNETLGEMESSTGSTAKAYGKMTSTAEYAEKVFQNSANNLKIAIGEQISPAVEGLYEMGSDILDGIAEFVDANPEVVGAITAITAGVGVFTGALALYTVGSKVAAIATGALTAALEANPLFATVTILASVTAAIGVFAASLDNSAEKADELTESSKKQKREIDDLTKEYDEACDKYGETSYQATELKGKIDKLTSSFDENKQTYGELISKNEELASSYKTLKENDQTQEIEDEAQSSKNLADRLYELAGQTKQTASSKAEMLAIIEQLNEKFPELSLNYDDVINKSATTKEALMKMLDTEYDNKLYEETKQSYFDTKTLLDKEKAYYEELTNEMKDPYEKYMSSDGNMQAQAEWDSFWNGMVETTDENGNKIKKSFGEVYEESGKRLSDLKSQLDEYGNKMAEIKGITDDGTKSQLSWEDATSQTIQAVQAEIDELAQKYDEAYKAAETSINNTVGLFNELSNKSDKTTAQMSKLWEDQTKWITNYSENIQKAEKYGLTDGLIDSLSDGTEKSGQYINQIISELDKMNASDAKELVKNLNEDFNGVKDAEGEFADTVAKHKTDFDDSMDGILEKAKGTIKDMNLSESAQASAYATIDAYINGITAKVDEVGSATDAVKNAVKTHLTPHGIVTQIQAIEQNAKGTKHSADIFIAGEEGPELIVNAGGSQVFTADETRQILNGDSETDSSGSSLTTILNIPELISQILEDSEKDKLSIKDIAGNIMNDSQNNYDNSVSSANITYSPTYQINSNQGASVMDDIKKAEKMSQEEFAKMMKQYNKSVARKSF